MLGDKRGKPQEQGCVILLRQLKDSPRSYGKGPVQVAQLFLYLGNRCVSCYISGLAASAAS